MQANDRRGAGLVVGMAWLLATSVASAAEQPARTRLAVLDLADKGVGEDVASLLTGVVANKLSELGLFEVISRDDIKNMLTHEQDKMLVGCTQADCLVDIGGALGARDLIAGEVGRVGTKYVIGLQRIDVQAAKVVKRTERQFTGSRERLLDEVATAAYRVVEDVLEAQSGSLLVTVSEEGADIAVDGKTLATSPVDRLEVPAGPRDVRVSKKGFVRWSRTVQIEPRGVQTLDVDLIPSAGFIKEYEDRAASMRTWAWITLGAFVALEAGAVGLRTYTYLAYDPIEDDYAAGRYGGLTRYEYWEKYHDEMETAEKIDYTALGLGLAGVVAGALSLYLFVEGDDPDRYERYRGLTRVVPDAAAVMPAWGGSRFDLVWRF